jgi:Domain of unknown function (DUF397)
VVDARRAIADTSVFIGFEQRRFDDQSLADLELGVSVALRSDLLAVRDSKNPDGPALNASLTTLLNAVKANRLSR